MGIYIYTLRKNPINPIDMDTREKIKIGVMAYAYKESFWNDSREYKMLVARSHRLAERARDANPDITLVVVGDPKNHDFDKNGNLTVYSVSRDLEHFTDTRAPGPAAGFIYKNGRNMEFERI